MAFFTSSFLLKGRYALMG